MSANGQIALTDPIDLEQQDPRHFFAGFVWRLLDWQRIQTAGNWLVPVAGLVVLASVQRRLGRRV